MNQINERIRNWKPLWTAAILMTALITTIFFSQIGIAQADPSEIQGQVNPIFPAVGLPSDSCGADSNCHFGSPVIADINGNGNQEVIAVTNKGYVVAISHNGQKLWQKDIAPYFNMPGGQHEIHSRPAVADLDGDGHVEIVIGAGTLKPTVCTQGGVIVLDRNGNRKAGWPFLAADDAVAPSGCRDTIFSSPALGDLDNDGDLEIVVGGFDKRIYALHHNGQLMANYPPDSALSARFPHWPDLRGKLADNMWGSPSLADIDGDGYLDIILTTGEGNFDASHGGNTDWSCPYALPPGWATGYCGGSLYVIDRFGNNLPGFPRYVLEAINSSPAVADVNGDGNLEIFMGTGDFYYNNSPSRPTYGYRLFAYDNRGRDLPGWGGGKQVGGTVTVSPSIGDIAGDGAPEIVVIASDRKLYAWHANGNLVSGFPMSPQTMFGQNVGNYNTPMGIVLADYDGDGKMEIIFSQSGNVNVVDGTGEQLTAVNPQGSRPIFYAHGQILNTPAVGDLNGDGKLELVATNSNAYVWNLSNSTNNADWPMFKRDAAGLSYVPLPPRLAAPDGIYVVHDRRRSGPATATIVLENSGDGAMSWQATNTPSRVTLSPGSGSFTNRQTIQVSISTSGLGVGTHNIGNIRIQASAGGDTVAGSPGTIPVTLVIAELEQNYLPMFTR